MFGYLFIASRLKKKKNIQFQLVINIPPRLKNPIFEDPDKTKKLEKLLQSKNPLDLEEANRLIKQMVKQVRERAIFF